MSGIPWESEERQNFIRADYIVSDVVRKELRSFFIQEWNKRYQASLGAWDDTNVSGSQLFNLEKSRGRPNKKMLQSKFQNGNAYNWDCTVLFDAILFSKSIGASLNPTQKTEIDNLRKLRNEITHKAEKTLNDADFQTKTTDVINALNALGLSSNEVVRVKNLYKSFQILPPKPTHEVVSRSDKIHEIREDLEKLRSDNNDKLTYFYISGNPGSGKSQLARQVCESIYSEVGWLQEAMFVMTLDGKDLDSLLHSYEDFCRRLNCNESVLQTTLSSSNPKDKKIKDLRSQICRKIKNWKKWWIIVDNVENLELIAQLLPLMGDDVWNNGQIIVTTQNTNAVPSDSLSSKHISLSLGMNDQECRQLLAQLSRTDVNDPLLEEVAEKLDHQPLAIAAAGVYMREVIEIRSDFSWPDYLEKLEKGKRELTEEHLKQTNSAAYSSTMSAAVLLAVTKCAEKNKILEDTFKFFSLISFKPLPLDLVVKYVQQQEEELDAEDIILPIKHCSLFVHVGNKEGDIRLHRVVHDMIKLLCLSKKTDVGNSVILNVTRTLYSFRDRKDKIKIISHLKAFLAEIDKLFPNEALSSMSSAFDETEIWEIYTFFGIALSNFSEFDLSLKIFQQTLKIALQRLGPKHIYVAGCYTSLGNVYRDKGDLDQAYDYCQQALEITLEQLGENNVGVARSYTIIGNVCKDKGNLEQANDYYQRALKIQLEQLGPNHVDVATSYTNLGAVCNDKGDLEQANDYYQQALKILLAELEPNHRHFATLYSNLGNICRKKDDLEKATNYFQKALKILLEQLGPNHSDVAGLYMNLGVVYHEKGDLKEGIDYYKRALKIQLVYLGENHREVAGLYNNLGIMCRDKGDLEQEYDYYQRALKIQLEQLGPNHIELATSYNNLGAVCSDKGDLEQANDYYQRALKIKTELLGPNHVDVAISYNNLGNVCLNKGNLEQAHDFYQQALKIQLKELGPNHRKIATLYNNLGNVYRAKGDLEQANDYYQRALKIQLEQLGPNHVNVANTYSNLGIVCGEKGDLEQANDYYQKALKIQLEQLGPNHVKVAASYNNLGIVCQKKGDLEQACDYCQRALKIQLEQLGPNHVDVASSFHRLGILCLSKRDLDCARDYLQRALNIQSEKLGPNHKDVLHSYLYLGAVYFEKDDLEHASHYFRIIAMSRK
ncbi:uncharacterized protein LOC114525852 [Dendronephthya gigantea]|uniref:uncharacterized protein LOC114525852 n=1 Tax=Dendronephthya gigantea TaxID=151771 RepID=UPI001068ECAC|nr:uncharacterized protein LOC114525852 [Dendronephthya gigantea]XP_028403110.1 uncharacterized protein LOC114525852 [Dendronephthya gigantea]XP_028403111.1 uncharacterized protein LOC114525852 [Dendronephthya gigantea]XP_028403112.1 uncharacterized protein LOC114525852 [Dendronephthya gigantea]